METCNRCGNALDAQQNCSYCMLKLGISQVQDEGLEEHAPSPLQEVPGPGELDRLFPQLDIKGLIGRGGMGAIYQARQTALDREVALKLIARAVANNTAFVERFEREAKTLAKLSHPNIVTVYDFGRTSDNQAFLVMEFVDGINLREAIETSSVGPDDALDVVSRICAALEYAHKKGIVHRDIKPENILLGEDGTLKVADFGIAKIVDDVRSPTLTATRQVLGSLHYLAPEHLEAPQAVDHRVDLYALGVVFYELLTGQLPLGRYEPPSHVRPGLNSQVDHVVMKLLDRNPEHRYQTAAEVHAELQQLSGIPVANDSQWAANSSGSHEAAANLPSSASVPFSIEAMGGFAEAVGILHARGDKLRAEYRMRDAIWGNLKSKTHVVDIDRADVASLNFHDHMFGSKLEIVAHSISALGSLPNAEAGRIDFKIKRSDARQAQLVCEKMGFRNAVNTTSSLKSQREEGSRWTVFGILLLLLGILNAGFLGMAIMLILNEIRNPGEATPMLILAIVGIGPTTVLQVLTGLLCMISRPKSMAKAASIVSMIPTTPAVVLGLPLALNSRNWLSNSERADRSSPSKRSRVSPQDNQPVPHKKTGKGWGATTMMYVRETRWGKVVAGFNLLLLVGATLLLGLFLNGVFDHELVYRIVDTSVDVEEVRTAVQSRIGGNGTVTRISKSGGTQPADRLFVRLGANSIRTSVERMLAVSTDVKIAWLMDAKQTATSDSQETSLLPTAEKYTIEIAAGVPVYSDFLTEEETFGTALRTLHTPVVLTSPDVAGASESYSNRHSSKSLVGEENAQGMVIEDFDGTRLIVELTSKGRQKLIDVVGEQPHSGLALIVNDTIVGIAPRYEISGRQVAFRLGDQLDVGSSSIIAAIRGPQIPSELEYLRWDH